MSAEQAQSATDGSGAAAGGLAVAGRVGIEQGLEVAIAESANDPLAPTQSPQQVGICPEGVQRPVAPAVVGDGAAERGGDLAQRTTQLGAG